MALLARGRQWRWVTHRQRTKKFSPSTANENFRGSMTFESKIGGDEFIFESKSAVVG